MFDKMNVYEVFVCLFYGSMLFHMAVIYLFKQGFVRNQSKIVQKYVLLFALNISSSHQNDLICKQ